MRRSRKNQSGEGGLDNLFNINVCQRGPVFLRKHISSCYFSVGVLERGFGPPVSPSGSTQFFSYNFHRSDRWLIPIII